MTRLRCLFGSILLLCCANPSCASEAGIEYRPGSLIPSALMVEVGDTVRWQWSERRAHVEAYTGEWKSPVEGSTTSGGSFSFLFEKPGIYPYFLQLYTDEGTMTVSRTGAITVSPRTDAVVRIQAPGNGFQPGPPGELTAVVTVRTNATLISHVELLRKSVVIGSSTSPPYRVDFQAVLGENTIVAKAVLKDGVELFSEPVSFVSEWSEATKFTNLRVVANRFLLCDFSGGGYRLRTGKQINALRPIAYLTSPAGTYVIDMATNGPQFFLGSQKAF